MTLLVTDIEDSSGRWERNADEMRHALGMHDEIVVAVIAEHGGALVKHSGDGYWSAFDSADRAASAAVDLLARLQSCPWDVGERIKVRVGLHTGEAEASEGEYFGPVANRVARVTDLGNGNQIACSSATAVMLSGRDLRSQGKHNLRNIGVDEIFLLVDDKLEQDPRPLRSPAQPPKLPRSHTSFLGRSDVLAQVRQFLDEDHALVTLVGPGGVGKTRAVVEAGRIVAARFGGGVHFCDLALVDGPDVTVAVAEAIGARRQPSMDLVSSIADYVSGRGVLIILDNCEHILDVAADLVARLCDVPGLSLLATSREALGLQGEQLVLLAPLPAETVGVELFVDRARAQDPGFELTTENEAVVRDISRRLDGIPLAIELAAARIRVMSPAEILSRLDDRFRLLRGARRGERHETLRDTVRWSFKLLDPAEAALFTRVSVFVGGFDLGAAEAVCADDDLVHSDDLADLVLALVQKSMITSERVAGRQRFRLLETLRRFGEEELAESETSTEYRRRHARYYADLAQDQSQRMWSPAEVDAWRVLDDEWANLRMALDTFEADGNVDAGAELVLRLTWFATMSMRFELFTWADELLATPGIEEHQSYCDLCGAAAIGRYFTVDATVTEVAQRGLSANPSDPLGFCRTALAAVSLNNLHTAEASDQLTTAWLASEPTEVGSRLWAEGFRTFHLVSHDPTPEMLVHAEATAAIAERTGSITAMATAAWAGGQVLTYDDLDAATQVWVDGLEWPRSLPGSHLTEHLLTGLILHVTARRAEILPTLVRCRDALQQALADHYVAGTSHLFGVSAIVLCRVDDAATGALLVGSMVANGHLPRGNAMHALEAACGDSVDEQMARGRSVGITEAAHLALEAFEAAIARQPPT